MQHNRGQKSLQTSVQCSEENNPELVELDPSPSWSKIGQGLHGREERVATPRWGWNTENMDPETQHPSLMGKN